MTAEEIKILYGQIEDLSNTQISRLISDELYNQDGNAFFFVKHGFVGESFMGKSKKMRWTPEKVMEICKHFLSDSSNSIRTIIKEHPKTTNYTLEIIQLVAPAIAQQYGGMPSLVIVGTLSILCKQGVSQYIS